MVTWPVPPLEVIEAEEPQVTPGVGIHVPPEDGEKAACAIAITTAFTPKCDIT
jgi:hypothetical protein